MQGDNLMMGLVWSLNMHNPGSELLASDYSGIYYSVQRGKYI